MLPCFLYSFCILRRRNMEYRGTYHSALPHELQTPPLVPPANHSSEHRTRIIFDDGPSVKQRARQFNCYNFCKRFRCSFLLLSSTNQNTCSSEQPFSRGDNRKIMSLSYQFGSPSNGQPINIAPVDLLGDVKPRTNKPAVESPSFCHNISTRMLYELINRYPHFYQFFRRKHCRLRPQ